EEEALSQLYAGMETEDPRLYLTYRSNESLVIDAEKLVGFTHSVSCWTSVTNSQGRAVGQVIGDCVQLNISRPLAGPMQLCLPMAPPELIPRNTDIFVSNVSHNGSKPRLQDTLDFGVLRTAERFDLNEAMEGLIIPDLIYGLLRPGDKWVRALGKQLTEVTETHICAKVMEQHWTYCPILRMNDSMHVWPAHAETFAEDTISAATSCVELDT
ncbi:hypothetical protein Pmar_PMAR008257, partial [Perkinsus marinus ATCC 50983]